MKLYYAWIKAIILGFIALHRVFKADIIGKATISSCSQPPLEINPKFARFDKVWFVDS